MLQPNQKQGATALPDRVGDYRIESLIGEGAVGTVYRARRFDDPAGHVDANHPSIVALKVLKPEATKQPHVLACFQFEARVLSRLLHRGILRVYAAGMDDDLMYTAMELIDGVSLDNVLAANKRLTVPQVIDVAQQLAEALDFLHSHGYVHRDVKPANLMLTPEGRVVLFDFGTVVRIKDGAPYEAGLYGTPAFLAPEQTVAGGKVDGRADLYAAGIMLYLMATGRKPFYGSRSEVLAAHVRTPPPPPSKFARMAPGLEAVILKAIAKNPDDRFQTGAEFARALADLPAPVNMSLATRLFGWLRLGR